MPAFGNRLAFGPKVVDIESTTVVNPHLFGDVETVDVVHNNGNPILARPPIAPVPNGRLRVESKNATKELSAEDKETLRSLGITEEDFGDSVIQSILRVAQKERERDQQLRQRFPFIPETELELVPEDDDDRASPEEQRRLEARRQALLRASEKQELMLENLLDAVNRNKAQTAEKIKETETVSEVLEMERLVREQIAMLEKMRGTVSTVGGEGDATTTEARMSLLEDASHRQLEVLEILTDAMHSFEEQNGKTGERLKKLEATAVEHREMIDRLQREKAADAKRVNRVLSEKMRAELLRQRKAIRAEIEEVAGILVQAREKRLTVMRENQRRQELRSRSHASPES